MTFAYAHRTPNEQQTLLPRPRFCPATHCRRSCDHLTCTCAPCACARCRGRRQVRNRNPWVPPATTPDLSAVLPPRATQSSLFDLLERSTP